MERNHRTAVTEEQRREFLKAVGVGGAIAASGLTLEEVRNQSESATHATIDSFAPVGETVRTQTAGSLDGNLLDSYQASFTDVARTLPELTGTGVPANAQRSDFEPVASAGQPIYDHLTETEFFRTTTEALPKFTPETITSGVQAFVASESLARPLADVTFLGEQQGDTVGLLAEVVANAEEISDYHWAATEDISRDAIELGEFVPPMTQGAAGGSLLWLQDLDEFLWKQSVLLTDELFDRAVWHARSMVAGFQLMTEGAKAVAEGSSTTYSDGEIGTILTIGFAVQAIAQGLLPRDVYWVTDAERSTGTYEKVGANEYRTTSATGGDST